MRRLAANLVVGLLGLVVAACSESEGDGTGPDTAVGRTGTATASPTATAAPKQLGTATGAPHTQRPPDFEALPGAAADFGVLGGSVYRVEMPEEWNGELVLYAHGVRLEGNELSVGSPNRALRERWISEGYAWAASSYSENGYVPGLGADATNEVLDYVTKKYGEPERTYLYGVSMGGHVTALLLEHFPERYNGGLAVCGALGGQEQIDYLVAWGMAAEYISGVTLPTGQGSAAMAAALMSRLPKALGSLDAPTEKGQQFISVARELSGGERPFFLEGLRLNYQLNFGLLLLDPNRTTLAGSAATNEDTEYDIDDALGISDEQLNAGIRRLPANTEARDGDAHPDAVPTTGRIEDPLITLHNTGDLFVPITNEVSYREKAEAAGAGDLLVQRAIRDAGHCEFSDEEVVTAWDDLVEWVEDGKRPGGDDLTGDLSDIGRAYTNPVRPGDPGTK
ncbi:MAG: hypothetical protein IT303_06370 [Dehalococcoidia bacterium]|nr:hypothetical protein [Dehalococcoidia bacterium]